MQASDLRVRCSKVLSWSADQVPYVSEEERILTFTARLSAFTGFILLPFHVSQCGIYVSSAFWFNPVIDRAVCCLGQNLWRLGIARRENS
jgi:hypothetical protein